MLPSAPFRSSPFQTAVRIFFGLILLSLLFFAGVAVGFQKRNESLGASQGQPSLNGTASSRVLGVGQAPPSGIAKDINFELFWKVWQDLSARYYQQPVSERDLFYGALRGMTEAVGDPYTTYFEPKDAEAFSTELKGEFSGIGAEIGVKDGQLQVVAPLPGSPAERAGIRARDLILKINDEESLEMPVDEAVSKIRGPKGTKVTLELGRIKQGSATGTEPEAETLTIELTRDTIVIHSVIVTPKPDGIFLIAIHSFGADTEVEFRKAVDQAIEKKAKGIVVDLRNDPGGYLDAAIAVAGEWMRDEIVVQQRERGEITERYKGTGRGRLKGMKTVLLVNEGSASASEILAGALQDAGIATIVGKTTFGKGSVQDYQEYDDGSALKVTIAEWLTPAGRSIHHEGITPDVSIDLTAEDIHAERDPQLEKALELLRTGQAKP